MLRRWTERRWKMGVLCCRDQATEALLLLPAECLTKGPVASFFVIYLKSLKWCALKPSWAKFKVCKPQSRQLGSYGAHHLDLFLPFILNLLKHICMPTKCLWKRTVSNIWMKVLPLWLLTSPVSTPALLAHLAPAANGRGIFTQATEGAGWSDLHHLTCHQQQQRAESKWLFLCGCIRVPVRMNWLSFTGLAAEPFTSTTTAIMFRPKSENRNSKAEAHGGHSVPHSRLSFGLALVWSTGHRNDNCTSLVIIPKVQNVESTEGWRALGKCSLTLQ